MEKAERGWVVFLIDAGDEAFGGLAVDLVLVAEGAAEG